MKQKPFYRRQTAYFLSVLLLIGLTVYFIKFGFIAAWSDVHSDFPNYYTSSKLLIESKDISKIYNDEWFQARIYEYGIDELGKFSPFPPATSFIMIVPAFWNPITAKRIYTIFNLLILFFVIYLFMKISGFSFIVSADLLLLSGAALSNNFVLGQFYLILLLLITLGYYLMEKKNGFSSGIFWGLGAAVKYLPIIFFPIMLRKQHRKTLNGFLVSFLLLNVVGVIVFGLSVYLNFISSVLLPHLNGELSSQSQFAHQFQSWNSFLRNIFVYDPVRNPNPLINWHTGFILFRITVYAGVIFLTIVSYLKIVKHPSSTALGISLLSTALLLLSPASASYHFLILSLPTILLLRISHESKELKFGFVFLIIYSAIGFLQVILKKFIPEYDSNLFLSFFPLWLITGYFLWLIYFYWYVLKKEPHIN